MLKYKLGGIIVGGVLHSEKNKIGDKGVPVVTRFTNGKYDKRFKTAEIERGEIIFNRETSLKIEKLINDYNDCGCNMKLIELGKLVKLAIDQLDDKQCEINNICKL